MEDNSIFRKRIATDCGKDPKSELFICEQMKRQYVVCKKCNFNSIKSLQKTKPHVIIDFETKSEWLSALTMSKNGGQVVLFDHETLSVQQICKSGNITSHKFGNTSPNLLFCSVQDGRVTMYDLRENNTDLLHSFSVSISEKPSLISVSVNKSDTYVCASSELMSENAYVLFWDIRQPGDTLGAYWESHMDDITQVSYNPTEDDVLISGSLDGLINVYDTSKSSESDALINTLNTESSVYKIKWMEDDIACLTAQETFQYWQLDKVSPSIHVNREDISHTWMNETSVDYLVDCFQDEQTNQISLFTGSNNGNVQVSDIGQNRESSRNLFLVGHDPDCIVRSTYFSSKDRMVFTGDDNGSFLVWKSK